MLHTLKSTKLLRQVRRKLSRFVHTLHATTSSTEKVVLAFTCSEDIDSVAGLYKYFRLRHDWHDKLTWMNDRTYLKRIDAAFRRARVYDIYYIHNIHIIAQLQQVDIGCCKFWVRPNAGATRFEFRSGQAESVICVLSCSARRQTTMEWS
jgi:hypothetical protein